MFVELNQIVKRRLKMIKNNKAALVIGAIVLSISMVYTSLMTETEHNIYTVNLGKIVSAQMLIAGRMAAQNNKNSLWMTTIKDTSSKIKSTIKSIAGNHVVIVTPAVVQGSVDITNQVLKKLGLPTNVPTFAIPKSKVIPSLFPRHVPSAEQHKSKEPSWMRP